MFEQAFESLEFHDSSKLQLIHPRHLRSFHQHLVWEHDFEVMCESL